MAGQNLFTMKIRYLLVVAGLAVFLLYLYLFVPFNGLIETVQKINPFYFFLAFCALLASVALFSLAWKQLLSLLSVRASFLKAFQYVWVEIFVDLVIPGEPVSGEVSRIYLMSKDTGRKLRERCRFCRGTTCRCNISHGCGFARQHSVFCIRLQTASACSRLRICNSAG